MFNMPEWMVYATMPLIAALIGWITKVAAVEMMFRPLEFKGIPPYLGWQGVIPKAAARMASISVDLMMRRILKPEELIGLINVDELMVTLREPMAQMVDQMTREIMLDLQPTLWEMLPEAAKRAFIRRVEAQVPATLSRMLEDMKDNVEDVIDIRGMAIEAMVRDKALTNRLVRTAGKDAFAFIIRFGIPSGLLLGGLQAVVWALTKNQWVIPAFGALIGLSTDWLALQMIFRPIQPRRFGLITYQGLFHRKRARVTEDYASLMANELLSPANMLEAMMVGPRSDNFLALIDREMSTLIDSRSGPMKPLLVLAVGGGKYVDIKRRAAAAVIEQMRANQSLVEEAAAGMNLAGFLQKKMALMTNEEYEDLLRPAFKQDEWKIVVVGAVLGFLVGELQVHLLLT
jgi:uncharacterized membrane protein YheB (UPF0754 family)